MWKELLHQMLLSYKLMWVPTISLFECPIFGTLTVPNAGQDSEQLKLLPGGNKGHSILDASLGY